MTEKKSSAVQRVFKSVVGPMLGTSLVFVAGCSTTAPPTDKPTPMTMPEGVPPMPLPGKIDVVTPTTQGAVVSPTSTPASTPVSLPVVGITKPPIPEPGKIVPVGKKVPEKVGKIAPTEEPIHKVGKTPNPGIIRPPGKVPQKVGIVAPDLAPEGALETPERPTRFTRRTTDESGGVLRTGFVGGRKLT